jgi:hypothetical protein
MKLNNRSNIGKLLLMLLFMGYATLFSKAQIYEPEGLNIPGSWAGWENPPLDLHFAGEAQSTGGNVQLKDFETSIYQTIFYVNDNEGIASGFHEFKFTSGPLSNIWQNQWADVQVQLNTLQNYNYGSDLVNNTITLNNDKWYVLNFENKGYESSRAIFLELSSEPAAFADVQIDPLMPMENEEVEVEVTMSHTPAMEEKIYIRYTTNNWQSSEYIQLTGSGESYSVNIPGMPDNTDVEFYLLSSVENNPSDLADFYSIHMDDNEGDLYSYEVGGELECGSALSLLSTQPAFPLENSEVIISFNAVLGNGGLAGYEGDVYVHTGVITDQSTGTSDWKYVKTDWGENTPETRLTKIDDDLYELSMSNIRDYYGVPSSEEILQMAMVFRSDEPVNGTAYLEGKTTDNQDIFALVYEEALNVKITYPVSEQPLVNPNSLLPVCVASLQADSIQLSLDGDYLVSSMDESLIYGLNTSELSAGSHYIFARAFSANEEVVDTALIYIRSEVVEENLPDGMVNGINYLNDESVTLVLPDPVAKKDFVFVVGDFNNWQVSDEAYMKRTPDGTQYWITIDGLTPGEEYAYQYYIDAEIKIADPFTEKILDPWNDKWIPEETYPNLKDYPFGKTTGIVSVLQTAQEDYEWQIENFVPVAINETQSNLIIYELLIRDFVGDSHIKTVMDSLDYLKNLGITAIELMPINEFEGNDSWGYNPSFYFATDKAYGTKNDYKAFIDACHERGIAVILDIVLNHSFGQSPLVQMYWDGSQNIPTADNPWYNQMATHPLSPGYDFNHESPHTRSLMKEILSFWLEEYKVDGYRFDLSKGFTQTYSGDDIGVWSQYDQSRVNILNDYYQHIKSVDPNAYVILEHLANNDEEVALGNAGMLLWANMNHEFNEATMGWIDNSNYNWAYYNERGFTYPNIIPYMESHDEERLMYKNLEYGNASGGYDITDEETALGRISAVTPMYFMVPGPKMMWQFGELGYDYSINHCPDGSISEDCRTSKKPIHWEYYNDINRQEVYQTFAAMAKLKTSSDAFIYGEYGKDLGGSVKRAWVSHSSMNVCAGTNFDVVSHSINPGFQHEGTWYNYFTGESIEVGSDYTIDMEAGAYYVFTDQDMGRPYVKLDFTVVREEDQSAIPNAVVLLQEMGQTQSNSLGEASFLPFSNRSYTYQVTAGGASTSGSISIGEEDEEILVQLKDVSAVNELDERFEIYPNPAGDVLMIETPLRTEIQITNQLGQSMGFYPINIGQNLIDVSKYPVGVYIIQMNEGQLFKTRKFIKE